MKVAIVGSRTFTDYKSIEDCVSKLNITITEIISGGASGADSMAKRYANEHSIPITEFLPDWQKYGRSAGPIRNKEIISNCDCVIACWDGKSKGTKSSIDIAKKLNKPINMIWMS